MLQVKDPQEVFDEHVRPSLEFDIDEQEESAILNSTYSIFVLGEMYGTISTCLAQNIPIPKEMWDMPVIKSMVRGDVDDVVELTDDELKAKMANTQVTSIEITDTQINVSNSDAIAALKAQGFDLGSLLT
tara:strand:- start:3400 stop:3789 length:390 start_codon:yes stop_codon:yes gene_type:complete